MKTKKVLTGLDAILVQLLTRKAKTLLQCADPKQTQSTKPMTLANKISKGLKRAKKSLAFVAANRALKESRAGIQVIKSVFGADVWRVITGMERLETYSTTNNVFNKRTLDSIATRKQITINFIGA
jgi:predicted DCC family thiol-disulfide oxidoreductase YuxK